MLVGTSRFRRSVWFFHVESACATEVLGAGRIGIVKCQWVQAGLKVLSTSRIVTLRVLMGISRIESAWDKQEFASSACGYKQAQMSGTSTWEMLVAITKVLGTSRVKGVFWY